MGLEVGRPVRNQGIADAVGLVEGIAGEGLDQVEYLGRQRPVESLAQGPADKPVPLFSHQGSDFLAHGLAHRVCLAQRIAGKPLQDQQYLVLVHNHPIRLVQQFLQAGMGICNASPAVLGLNEGIDMLHGPWTVKGNHCRNVAQVGRLQLLDIPLHPGAFQLEQVRGLARRQEVEGLLVVQGQSAHVNLDALGLIQELGGPVQNGQVGQAQEVHLQQAQLGHRVHGILGHQHRAALVAPGGTLQGNRFRQGFVGNEDAGCVGADVVDDSLQALGVIHQVVNGVVGLIGIDELRIDAQGIVQGAGLEGDHSRNPVHIAIAHAQAAPHVS